MKYIFDFDNVLFDTSKKFKEHMILVLEKIGVSPDSVRDYCDKERWNQFSLKKMLNHFSVKEDFYEKIMSKNKNFVNGELIEVIKKLGRSNCFILTYGDEEFQLNKIKRTGIGAHFVEIIVVSGSKEEAIEKICDKYKKEKVLFIDDKTKHFEDLDFKKYPNLKTIFYDENGLEKLKAEIKENV
jgi:FMN phosphatase YigB (HAD superfamily)